MEHIKTRLQKTLLWFAIENAKALTWLLFWLCIVSGFHRIAHAEALHFGERLQGKSIVLTSDSDLDLDKLAKAVAMHETANCTAGSARYNNCHGIRYNGSFARYKTKADSYKDFKRIWGTYYKRFPDFKLAKKYSGNDRAAQWLANVTRFYNAL